jgi:hypothetical protein
MKFRLFYLDYPFKKRRIYLRFPSVLTGDFNHFEHKICKTKPNSETPKMNISPYSAMTTNNEQPTSNSSKQSQTKPNLPAMAGKFVPSAVEGPHSYMAGKIALPALECRYRGSVAEGPIKTTARLRWVKYSKQSQIKPKRTQFLPAAPFGGQTQSCPPPKKIDASASSSYNTHTIKMTKRQTQNKSLPQPSLEHLKRLTDYTGIYQHARRTIPYREEGYCTDDNARAVMATAKYYARYRKPKAIELFNIYLSFIIHSQNGDGSVKNLMNFDRTWRKDEPGNDALGRVLWALGMVLAEPPSPVYLPTAKDCFDSSLRFVEKQFQKGKAYSILGMSDYLKRFPDADNIKKQMETAADSLIAEYEENNFPDWHWFDGALTYDNAILPYALFVAASVLGKKYLEIAEKTCEFLLANIFNGSHFSFIGCLGWYKRGQTRAHFDQQPIEVASTIMMLKAAYDATGNDKFLTLQRKAFQWFLGENDLHLPLYDSVSKGCHDGLMSDGVNPNQGAESTLSFLLSLLTMIETVAGPTAKIKAKKNR